MNTKVSLFMSLIVIALLALLVPQTDARMPTDSVPLRMLLAFGTDSDVGATVDDVLNLGGRSVGVIDTDIQSTAIHILFGLGGAEIRTSLKDCFWRGRDVTETALDVRRTSMQRPEASCFSSLLSSTLTFFKTLSIMISKQLLGRLYQRQSKSQVETFLANCEIVLTATTLRSKKDELYKHSLPIRTKEERDPKQTSLPGGFIQRAPAPIRFRKENCHALKTLHDQNTTLTTVLHRALLYLGQLPGCRDFNLV